MVRKGISPLISAVLLLAVTLSMAALFSGWGPSLVNTVTDSTENQTERTINCNEAGIEIIAAKYYPAGQTSIVVRNTGRSELDNLEVSAWKGDLPMNNSLLSALAQGNFTTSNVTTSSKPDDVRAFSRDCTSVQDTHEEIG